MIRWVDDEPVRTIGVGKLLRLLIEHEQVGLTDVVKTNTIGNLAILRDGEYVGYVDLGKERVEMLNE